MKRNLCNKLLMILILFLAAVITGCSPETKGTAESMPANLDNNIGALARFYQFQSIPVTGYGIVAGLAETGSSECPPAIRDTLIKYIWKQLPPNAKLNPEKFLSSKNTAVVEIFGIIPPLASKGQNFDLKIRTLAGTQTTSLDGGRLYTAELKEMSGFEAVHLFSKPMATAQGPVFINKFSGIEIVPTTAYVLGGGTVIEDNKFVLGLIKPDYIAANAIRNRINQRFGSQIAKAVSHAEIEITIPREYRNQRQQFLSMIELLYLSQDRNLQQRRIEALVEELIKRDNKLPAEFALMAIGKVSAARLSPLLSSPDPVVKFHAARCMLSIGDEKSLPLLRDIIQNTNSPYRVDAVKAIGIYAKRKHALPTLNNAVADSNFELRFAAYEQLRRLQDTSVSQILVAGDFLVDTVTCGGPKVVYVSRIGHPRIVIFGAPLRCEKNIFINSADDRIVINASEDDRYISVMRKHPTRPKLLGPLKAGFEVTSLIQTLCNDINPVGKFRQSTGLGVPYADVIALLKQMCDKKAIKAEFRSSQSTQINLKASAEGIFTDKNAK